MDGGHPELQQNGRSHNGPASPGQQPPHVTPPPPNQQPTSTGDLLRQCEQVVALLQQRQPATSSSASQRRRQHSIGNPDQQRQQQLSGHPAGGHRPSGHNPTSSSLPHGRQRPPSDDDLLFQCAQMMMLIVHQRQSNLNLRTITEVPHSVNQPDTINQPTILEQQIREHGGSTALAPSAVKAINASPNQLQQLVGESVVIDQHYRRQQALGGPQQLLGSGLSGSSISLSLQRGTFGCHHAVPASIVQRPRNAFSHQQLSHRMEIERCHHFASHNAHRVLLHFSRLPLEVTSGPCHRANGPRIEACTHGASVVEPSAHQLSALWQQKGTDSTARLHTPSTPASTAIQPVPFERPNHLTVLIIGHQSVGAELATCYADSGVHQAATLSQHVVKSYREGRGATGKSSSTLLRVLRGTPHKPSEVCPNILTFTDGSNERKSCDEMRHRVDCQASSEHPSWAANIRWPLDILNEWQLPRPPQTSSSSSTPKPSTSSSPLTIAPFNHGSTGDGQQVVDHPHRSSQTRRAPQLG